MNTDALRSSYQAIVNLATTGEFGPPPADEFDSGRALGVQLVWR